MLKKTLFGTFAAGAATGIGMFLHQMVRQFAVVEWVRDGQPSVPAVAGTFAIVLIGVGGADLVRFFVKAATRS